MGGHQRGAARSYRWSPALRQARSRCNRARALAVSFPDIGPGLRVHDRLEPNASLLNVAKFDDITVFPARVLFWRGGGHAVHASVADLGSRARDHADTRNMCAPLARLVLRPDATLGLGRLLVHAFGKLLGPFRGHVGRSDQCEHHCVAWRALRVVQIIP